MITSVWWTSVLIWKSVQLLNGRYWHWVFHQTYLMLAAIMSLYCFSVFTDSERFAWDDGLEIIMKWEVAVATAARLNNCSFLSSINSNEGHTNAEFSSMVMEIIFMSKGRNFRSVWSGFVFLIDDSYISQEQMDPDHWSSTSNAFILSHVRSIDRVNGLCVQCYCHIHIQLLIVRIESHLSITEFV
jgi:hypothetical protein